MVIREFNCYYFPLFSYFLFIYFFTYFLMVGSKTTFISLLSILFYFYLFHFLAVNTRWSLLYIFAITAKDYPKNCCHTDLKI